MRPALFLVALSLAGCQSPVQAQQSTSLCPAWSEPERVGAIDPVALKEASGIAVSRAIPGRLYHHNDSGMGPKFFTTASDGSNLRTVTIAAYEPRDIEDMSMTSCGNSGGDTRTCLVFGDIGDNSVKRESVTFVFVPEKRDYADTETALRMVKARYPDGPHNAEGFAFHPDGDLYLLTKVSRAPAQIFRLTAAQMKTNDGSVQTFTPVGSIDVPALAAAPGEPPPTGQVTAFDISPDGKRALILTYGGAIEIAFDMSKPLPPQPAWREGADYRRIALARLLQLEAIAYAPDGKSFVYDSELPAGTTSPLYRQTCQNR
jgi:hypothetical protein